MFWIVPMVMLMQHGLGFEAKAPEPVADDSYFQAVHLFQHGTDDELFPGNVWRVESGQFHHEADFDNDEISAVLVPEGLMVVLYSDPGLEGRRLLLGPGMHNLAIHDFNDEVSSVFVKGPPVLELFEHSIQFDEREGESWRLPLSGEHHEQWFEAEGDFLNDSLSTVRVPVGHEVILFDDASCEGIALVLKAGEHELDPLGFNDRVSAIRVLRARQ